MPSLLHVTDKTSHFTSVLKDVHECLRSSNPQSDLVFLCSDKVEVVMHQAVLVNLSNMLREMLPDNKNYFSQEYPLLVHLDHDSNIAMKMVELIFTGKSVVDNQKDFQSLQNLLSSLGICLDLAKTAGSAEYDTQTLDVTYEDIDLCNEAEEPVKKKLKSTEVGKEGTVLTPSINSPGAKMINEIGVINGSQVLEESSSVQVAWYSSTKHFSLTNSLQAHVQLKLSDKVGSGNIKKVLKRHHREVSKLDSRCGEEKQDIEVVKGKAERTVLEFFCPVCTNSAKFKIRNKFIKHLVDDHYYEELENLLVGEFFESSVCCKIDFAKSGFGMFIRHNAEKHKAVQKVATEEVGKSLDSQDNNEDLVRKCEIKVAADTTMEEKSVLTDNVKNDVRDAAYDISQEESVVKK